MNDKAPNKVKARQIVLGLFLVLWVAVSLTALGSMWKLWWTRERVLYEGQSAAEQRAEVFRRIGLPPGLPEKIEGMKSVWPYRTRYQADGDPNALSYIKYLLIPDIPSGDAGYRIAVDRSGRWEATGVPLQKMREPVPSRPLSGFLLSLLLVLGLSFPAARFSRSLSIPERVGVGLLLLCLLAVGSRALTGSSCAGFWAAAGIGAAGFFPMIGKIIGVFSNDWKKIRAELSPSLWPSFLLVAGFALWSLAMAVVVVPDDWDAWAIWGAKAKVLALGLGSLRDVTFFGQPDYPLLWPAAWAFSGWCSGGWEEQWAKAWGPLCMVLCAGQLAAAIRRQTQRKDFSWLGAAMFVSVPAVPLIASWAYAEAPLWLMTVCSFGRLLRWRDSGERTDLLLAGIFAAGAAHTKNEGAAFAVLALIWLILNRKQTLMKDVCAFFAPVLLLYLPWMVWVKVSLGLGSHATAGLRLDGEHFCHAASRLPEALRLAAKTWGDIRQWSVVLVPLLAAGAWLAVRARRATRLDVALPLGMLMIYFLINVFHYADLGWQMGSSWNRLTVQALPLLCLAVISALSRRIEE